MQPVKLEDLIPYASRTELLALLARDLGKLDDDFDDQPSRACARRVIMELVTRYGIDLAE